MQSAIQSLDVSPRTIPSVYPEPFKSRMNGRVKRQLGEFFGIKKYGVNLTEISPGGESALMHHHSKQEEFIYIIEGQPTLVLENEEIQLFPGMCTGFTPIGSAHKLENRTKEKVLYLEVGDREKGDEVTYPRDDLAAAMGEDGKWVFRHKDGTTYQS